MSSSQRVLRIAQVSATFPPYTGGAGNVCFYQARGLARLGFDVHVFTCLMSGALPFEKRDGVTIHRLMPLLKVGNAALPATFWRGLKGFDLIHLHYPFYGGEASALLAWLQASPLVLTYHQDVLLSGCLGWVEAVLRRILEKAVLQSASQVLFTSLDYYAHSHARLLLQGRESSISELPNGVDVQRFTPSSVDSRVQARFPWQGDRFVALMVASLDRAHSFKGVDVFLRALFLLPSDLVGVIVGEGVLRKHYEQLAAQYGLGQRVFFAGRVPDEELPAFYTAADVTLLPSIHRGEAFGLVLLESMACGTPVIASCLPGVRTLVANGVDGLLVEPGSPADLAEKVFLLVKDPSLRCLMGENGRQKVVERYAWEKIIPRLVEVYRAAVALR